MEDHFEGVNTVPNSDLSLAGLTRGEMTVDQMEALDMFFVGVGFATTKEFEEYDERAFGTWKFF